MTPAEYRRIYKVRLACDLLDGLENPGSMETTRSRVDADVVRFPPWAEAARRDVAHGMLRSLGVPSGTNYEDLQVMDDREVLRYLNSSACRDPRRQAQAEEREERRQERAALAREARNRPGRGTSPGRAPRNSLEAMLEIGRRVSANPPADLAPQNDIDELISRAARSGADEAITSWGLPRAGTPPFAPNSEDDDELPAERRIVEVDVRTGEETEIRLDREGRPIMSGKTYRKAVNEARKQEGKPAGKPKPPARRLVIGRKRPPVAPDE